MANPVTPAKSGGILTKLRPLLKLGVKGGIAGGVIYSAYYFGVWGNDTAKTQMAFKQTASTIDGYLGGDYVNQVHIPFPSSQKVIEKWNGAVTTSFTAIDNIPNYVTNSATSAKNFLSKKTSD